LFRSALVKLGVGSVALSTVALAVVLACSAAPPATTPSLTPTAVPDGPLLTVTARGGMCPPGACQTTIFIERDGRVHQAAKPPNELGQVPDPTLTALERAIASADVAAIRSRPFTGTCPTAWDGQELVFDFGAPAAIERVESCKVDIDWHSPLFAATAAAVGPYMALPTP
jgi:hypothetical protein